MYDVDIGIICGYISGVITIISLIPQIITMLRTKSYEGISWIMVLLMLLVSILNLVYCIIAHLWPLIWTNIFTIFLWSWILYLYLYYRYKNINEYIGYEIV